MTLWSPPQTASCRWTPGHLVAPQQTVITGGVGFVTDDHTLRRQIDLADLEFLPGGPGRSGDEND